MDDGHIGVSGHRDLRDAMVSDKPRPPLPSTKGLGPMGSRMVMDLRRMLMEVIDLFLFNWGKSLAGNFNFN